MTNLLTQAECFDYAKSAGFTDSNAEIMAAIDVTETLTFYYGTAHADADMVGDLHIQTDVWGGSYGQGQVRSKKAELGKGTLRDASRLADPLFNARSCYQIWKDAGGSFRPWSTFTSGAYLGAMQHATFNPKPVIPAGSVMVKGGDTLSKIGATTGFPWRLIAALNNSKSPYTIHPGQVILLPDWPCTVVSGDSLSKIATANNLPLARLVEYNTATVKDQNKISVGQVIKVPRYLTWDGVTLVR